MRKEQHMWQCGGKGGSEPVGAMVTMSLASGKTRSRAAHHIHAPRHHGGGEALLAQSSMDASTHLKVDIGIGREREAWGGGGGDGHRDKKRTLPIKSMR